jgi:hypothetical protein
MRRSFLAGIFLPCTLMLSLCTSLQAQQRKQLNDMTVSFPNKTWSVEVGSPGFLMRAKGRKPDGRYYLFANDPRTGVILSVMLEQSPQADASSCPAYLQQRVQSVSKLGFVAADVKSSEANSLAVVEYMIPAMEGKSVQQKNIVACAARDGVYVDIHLSKSQFQQGDEALLMDVLNQIQISGAAAPAQATASLVNP